MDVHLLAYDLSRGLARQFSMGILGFQLDAIYHTSIELDGREYVYDGGIVAIVPGSSHLGRPLQRLHLGTTHLPMDVIEEFLDSIRPIFTFEARPSRHPRPPSPKFANMAVLRPTIFSTTTATTLPTPFPTSSWGKAYPLILQTCLKLS